MRRFIVLLLITGTVWAQTGLDKLVLKDGTEFLGECAGVTENVVYFKSTGELAYQVISISRIQSLQLKNGKTIIRVRDNYIKKWTILDYKPLSIKDKATYDAKKESRKWILYPPAAFSIFVSSIYGTLVIAREEPWESFPATLGISAASLTIPYLLLKALTSKKTENFDSKDKKLYEEMYHKEFKKEKLKNIIIGIVLVPLLGFTILVLSSDDSDNNDWRLPSFPP